MKRKLFTFLSLFFLLNLVAQDYNDYLIDENNVKLFCKITQIKNGKVKYKLRGKSYSTIKSIVEFNDVYFSNPKVLKNPLGLKIEKPESGYAHVYFYYSSYVYKVKHNDKKLVKIGIGDYFLHKIKAGEVHKYYSTDHTTEIDAKNGEVYLIRGKQSGLNHVFEINKDFEYHKGLGYNIKLFVDNRKVSEYALLSMKKKVEN